MPPLNKLGKSSVKTLEIPGQYCFDRLVHQINLEFNRNQLWSHLETISFQTNNAETRQPLQVRDTSD